VKHSPMPLDAYPDSWRCPCGEIFRSDAGWAVCPNSTVKGFVRKFGPNWFYYVSIDGEAGMRGQTGSWAASFTRVFRMVQAMRPVKIFDGRQADVVKWI